jgi:hypothetical protein
MESRIETLKQERAKIAESELELADEMLQRLEKALSTVGFDLANRSYSLQLGKTYWELFPTNTGASYDNSVKVFRLKGKACLDRRPLV